MKQIHRLLSILLLVLFFQTGTAFAQIGTAISLLGHGAVAIAGSGHQSKQDKIIDQSTQQEKISGSNISILRVKESDIKSKAKDHIIKLQDRLDQYNAQYKNNQLIDIPKNDSDLMAIQNIDENWPTEYYGNELRAYKRYVYQLKQKAPAATVESVPAMNSAAKKDTGNIKL
jgi:hypothetical protein